MRHVILASALLVFFTVSSFAQEPRGHITLAGGFAKSTDGTSGNVVAELDARVATHLSLFGSLGRFHDLERTRFQPIVDVARDELSESTGLDVVGTAHVPTWYSLGGVRLDGSTYGRVAPYVTGGLGLAHLTPRATFTYADGAIEGATPLAGDDITSELAAMGAFQQVAAMNALMYQVGTGAALALDRHLTLDVGYRYGHVDTNGPLHVQSVTFGMGVRF